MIGMDVMVVLLVPAVLLWAAKHVGLIRLLSPAFFCYVGGILYGNLGGASSTIVSPIMEGSVGLAIPLLLFSADLRAWMKLARNTVLSYVLYLIAIAGTTTLAFFLFRTYLEEPAHAAAMAASVYTGGTANMGAIQLATGASGQLFGAMNLSDLSLSGLYLMVLLPFGKRIFGWLLPPFQADDQQEHDSQLPTSEHVSLSLPQHIRGIGFSLLLGIATLGGIAGLSWLIYGRLEESFLLIGITLGGLALSLIPAIRQAPMTYPTGQYIFLVFCVGVGTLVDVQLLVGDTALVIGFMAPVSYGGIILHTLLARLLKLDADTVLITNVAGIFGPPFIGPIADNLKNRAIVVTGLTLAVLNLALGNLFGLVVFWMLGG
ncbi:MAG: DUF819 family protein [Bacteroidota bacterium]